MAEAKEEFEVDLSRATIRDVSRLAGVSIKTVSRVLNNQKYVTAETRGKIVAVMDELNFQPNAAARALAGHRSHQVAIICDNPSPWYIYEIQQGARLRCQQDGVRMLAQPYDHTSSELLQDIVSLIDQVRPDGLILTPPVTDYKPVLDELIRRKVPFVRIQPGTHLDLSPSVFVDNERAAYDMTAHLMALGHRRIGFIVGRQTYAVSGQRLNGYIRALSEGGLSLDLTLVKQGNFDFESGAKIAEEFLDMNNSPSAIFASNDDMAAGALTVAHQRGIAIPDDLSIVGFDDTTFAKIVWPALTTIRQPVRELAQAAADLLLRGKNTQQRRLLTHELVVRNSAGSAPS